MASDVAIIWLRTECKKFDSLRKKERKKKHCIWYCWADFKSSTNPTGTDRRKLKFHSKINYNEYNRLTSS